MGVARNVMLDPRLVPGGGATEMAISRGLQDRSSALQGTEQVRALRARLPSAADKPESLLHKRCVWESVLHVLQMPRGKLMQRFASQWQDQAYHVAWCDFGDSQETWICVHHAVSGGNPFVKHPVWLARAEPSHRGPTHYCKPSDASGLGPFPPGSQSQPMPTPWNLTLLPHPLPAGPLPGGGRGAGGHPAHARAELRRQRHPHAHEAAREARRTGRRHPRHRRQQGCAARPQAPSAGRRHMCLRNSAPLPELPELVGMPCGALVAAGGRAGVPARSTLAGAASCVGAPCCNSPAASAEVLWRQVVLAGLRMPPWLLLRSACADVLGVLGRIGRAARQGALERPLPRSRSGGSGGAHAPAGAEGAETCARARQA